jgi:hypothetical protein
MKEKLIFLSTSFLSLISPAAPIIYIAILSIIVDALFGIWKSYKLYGIDSISSRKASVSISKFFLYAGAIMFVYLIEKYVAGDLISHFISIDLILTKLVGLYLVVVEIKSINENYKSVTSKDILSKFKSFVVRAKNEVDDLKL